MFALFHGEKQISKTHSTQEACFIEAFEKKLVTIGYGDFSDSEGYQKLANNHFIKKVG